ncbi:MAG: GNAT family N-acetyltransferase [Bacteroidetes bacterium]|nr:GNAT family N-acetyltransferase [Bacteroidota bacterium]
MQTWTVKTLSLLKDAPIWDRLHTAAPHASVFSSTSWLTVLAEVFERRATADVALRGDMPIAGIPLLTERRGPLRVSTPLPVTLYAGWVSVSSLPDEALSVLLAHIERRCHYVALGLADDAALIPHLQGRGWVLRRMHSRIISIEHRDDIWNGYSQSLRRKIRRAEDNGLHLDDDPPTTLLTECYERSYRRHGVAPPITAIRMQRWIDDLRRQDSIALHAARRTDGRCAAIRAVIRDGDTLYDWLAGADPEIAPSASHWLVHTLLERYSAAGCRTFDFMGANTPGVSDFKRGFGGSLHPYIEAEWYRPRLLKGLTRFRSRRILRRRGLQ